MSPFAVDITDPYFVPLWFLENAEGPAASALFLRRSSKNQYAKETTSVTKYIVAGHWRIQKQHYKHKEKERKKDALNNSDPQGTRRMDFD